MEATILVVDDTPSNIDPLQQVLAAHGFKVAVAHDGEEGLRLAEWVRPDLILLDIMMPGINGFETCRRLKRLTGLRDVPVIFMTALSDYDNKLAGFEAGGVDYITKPFWMDEVLARIRTHLMLRSMQQKLVEQNESLQEEILLRHQIEAYLQEVQEQLEERVAKRTAELAAANQRLIAKAREHDRTENLLKKKEARLRRLFESNIIGICFWDMDGPIREANEAFLQISGYSAQELLSGDVTWATITPAEYHQADAQAMDELRRTGRCAPYEKEYLRKDGNRIPVLIGAAVINDNDGNGVAFVLDLTERKAAENAVRQKEARIRRLFEANIIGIVVGEAGGRARDANDAFLAIIGYSRQDLIDGKIDWNAIMPPECRGEDRQAIEEFKQAGRCTIEKEFVRKNGSRVPVLIGAARFEDSEKEGVAFVIDLSERKRDEERIRYLADHDALTGLPNRALLQDRVKQALAHAHRHHTQLALLFIDLDYFKHINDSLGHQVGDCLLQMVAVRLQKCVRENDTVARLGGDEFVLSLPLEKSDALSSDAALIAQKVLQALDMPFIADGHELHVSGSIGISIYPDDGTDVEILMRAADTAMYHAKENGRGHYQFFTPALHQAAQQRMSMGSSLRHAFAHGEFALYYQPQVDLESGRILSAEALLRWRQPDKAPISCMEFIAIAEETGLILQIGEWALRQACGQLRQWHDLGHADLLMAVNLSPRQFYQTNFQHMVRDIVDQAGIPASSLDLEITESILMQRSEENVATLKRLSGMGIRLSIDDFGTGYSSLAYLQRFPVDALKIDRSFVHGIGQNSNDTALVTAIISMAHSLHLNVLAEGVETREQINFLLSRGCASAQGYYYSEAVSAETFTEMLQQQDRRLLDA